MNILEAEGLVKSFGRRRVVDGVHLHVGQKVRLSGCSDPTAPARQPPSA
jgi:ABC-type lipopolysaccharide export system ATPase subunit